MSDEKVFKEFEGHADKIADNLSILRFPRRSLLTALYLSIDSLIHGSRLNGSYPVQKIKGYALISRLSYLTNHILRCPAEPIGASAHDAFSIFDNGEVFAELQFLMAYGHLSELMPEVHRSYYKVSKSGARYKLSYGSAEFAEWEVRDIILSELARGFGQYPKADEKLFDAQAELGSKFDIGLLIFSIKGFYSHFLEHSYELQIVGDMGLEAAAGVTFEEFLRFKAGWMAIGQYCSEMAAAVGRRAMRKVVSKEIALAGLLEWTSPMLKETFLCGIIMALTDLTSEKIDVLLEPFLLDSKNIKQTGEGFFPPLLKLNGCFLFSPDALQLTISTRNIIYAFSRRDPLTFDSVVSENLEPRLIELACKLLNKIPDVTVVINAEWKAGEIDILVYQKSENAILHVQAKAAIPPEGARRVDAVEKRVLDGIEQLERFRRLEQSQIDKIVSSAVKETVVNVKIIDVLLVWAGFGTERVWSQMSEIVAINPPLLNLVINKKPNLTLSDFAESVAESLAELRVKTNPEWTVGNLMIGEVEVEIPLLNINIEELLPDKTALEVFS